MHRRPPNDCAGTHEKMNLVGISWRRQTSFSSLKRQRLHECQIIAIPRFSSFHESLPLGLISIYIRATLILLTISISVRHVHATDCTVSNLQACDCFKNSTCPQNILAPRIVARKQDADLKVVVPNIISLRHRVFN
ncbi:hypothetical protein KP509_35G032700 [Ceratopteris richardii]|uniref:Uncharacterized protein n=1 Tax=Ceratopteris richardii TaxID=49495 RepID=A0A8T2QFY3_CERRI|nr:hypothetical protein KP509_35G032700 [Ceratopteris richardii]